MKQHQTHQKIGIDLAKHKFDVYLINTETGVSSAGQFTNDDPGFEQLVAWLTKHGANQESSHICMEATGVYGIRLATFLHVGGWAISVVNPLCIKGHARSMALRSKNDRIDARCIADFCRTRNPGLWTPPPVEFDRIRQLLVRREQVKQMESREINALESVRDAVAIESCHRTLSHLKSEITLIEAAIDDIIKGSDELRSQATAIQTIPGFGVGTVPFMVSLMGGRNFGSARQAAAYVGLTPCDHESGTSVSRPPRISKCGDRLIRKQMWWPAVAAMRHPDFAPWVQTLREKGKAKKQIICAVMRKLIHIAFGVVKSGLPYDRKVAFPGVFS